MKLVHSTYQELEPIDKDRMELIVSMAKRLVTKWNKQNKKAPVTAEAKSSNK